MRGKQYRVVILNDSEYNTHCLIKEETGETGDGSMSPAMRKATENRPLSDEMRVTDMKKAIICMADGMEMCECLLTVDILRRAGVEVTTASVMDRREVTASHQVKIYADVMAEDADFAAADLLVLPGGRIGTENLGASELIREQCMLFAANDEKHLAAVCAAPSVLADLGLLSGKTATCHPDFEDRVAAGGAALTHDSVTVCGNIITGQGLGATMDFALTLTEILTDKETADRIRKAICYRY